MAARWEEPDGADAASEARKIEELRAEARYRRERYDLYRAKMYGPRPTSMARFRELEREHQAAEARLRRAEHDERAPDTSD